MGGQWGLRIMVFLNSLLLCGVSKEGLGKGTRQETEKARNGERKKQTLSRALLSTSTRGSKKLQSAR